MERKYQLSVTSITLLVGIAFTIIALFGFSALYPPMKITETTIGRQGYVEGTAHACVLDHSGAGWRGRVTVFHDDKTVANEPVSSDAPNFAVALNPGIYSLVENTGPRTRIPFIPMDVRVTNDSTVDVSMYAVCR
jgi:hypothetical protein